jgi:23S rRNA pseudouridine1911/1915/1917 synthase
MPQTDWGWLITPDDLNDWTLHEDSDLLVLNKPGNVLCHPSKHGPWSSLVGACREYLGVAAVHLPSRLDRETSGVVVVAKNAATGSRLQRAIQRGAVGKTYHAILCGELRSAVTVDQPIGKAPDSPVHAQRGVVAGGQSAQTQFTPVARSGGYTLARVEPRTGRMHQIRVHAAWLGHPVAGDKIYGPDPALFLEFLEHGWTSRHQAMLPIRRHALHASAWSYSGGPSALRFTAPPPADFRALLHEAGIDWDS